MTARLLHPLFALLASATRQELARQVAYLKEENRILRARLPKRITVTPDERRRLLKAGKKLGAAVKDLIQGSDHHRQPADVRPLGQRRGGREADRQQAGEEGWSATDSR
jgi:hypothetical protein